MPTSPPSFRPTGVEDANARRRAYDRDRDAQPWRSWYKTAAWQRKRAAQLTAEPLCAICREAGRITAATVADHVEPHRGDYGRFWHGRLQSLCDQAPWRCHSSVKHREERRLGR